MRRSKLSFRPRSVDEGATMLASRYMPTPAANHTGWRRVTNNEIAPKASNSLKVSDEKTDVASSGLPINSAATTQRQATTAATIAGLRRHMRRRARPPENRHGQSGLQHPPLRLAKDEIRRRMTKRPGRRPMSAPLQAAESVRSTFRPRNDPAPTSAVSKSSYWRSPLSALKRRPLRRR